MDNSLYIFFKPHFQEKSTDYYQQTRDYLLQQSQVCEIDFSKYFQQKRKFLYKSIYKDKNQYKFYFGNFVLFKNIKFFENLNTFINILFLYIYFRIIKKKKIILWIFHFDAWDYKKYFLKFFKISLYDCVDSFGKKDLSVEIELINLVKYFFVNSKTLQTKFITTRKAILLPQGFRSQTFNDYESNKLISKQNLFPKNKPLIGYVGGINRRLDYKLLYELVKNNSQWNFVLCGLVFDINKNDIKLLNIIYKQKNVIKISATKEDIPSIIDQFDVCIIPYLNDSSNEGNFNRECYPMKFIEFMYLGKPTVSSKIFELEYFPKYVKISNNINEWQSNINYYLNNPISLNLKNEAKIFALNNSWSQKINKILSTINQGK